jgi:hypothetical protein
MRRRQREADTRRQTFRWSTIAKASKPETRQIQPSEASNKPKHHDNDQEQTKNASKRCPSVAVMSVVPSAAKEKNQDKDDKDRPHNTAFRRLLIARAVREASTTSDDRRGCAEGRALC